MTSVSQISLGVLMANAGRRFFVLNSRPIFLNSAQKVYCVLQGKVELFHADRGEKGSPGARTHMVTVTEGGLFWGFTTTGLSGLVLASGVLGTEVAELDLNAFVANIIPQVDQKEVSSKIDSWVENLSGCLADVTGGFQIDQIVQDSGILNLKSGQRAGSARQTVWLSLDSPGASYMGHITLGENDSPSCIPIAQGCWVEADRDLTGSSSSTAALLPNPAIWQGILALNRWFFDIFCLTLGIQQVDDIQKQDSKGSYRSQARRDAWRSLITVIGEEPIEDAVDDSASSSTSIRLDDLLVDTVRQIGTQLGITIKRHPDIRASNDLATNLTLLSKTSRFRTRRVLLEGAWWHQDSGPMLAYRAQGETPVALLPTKPGAYELYDPITSSSEPVTRELAKTLAPFADTFYRSLPDGLINATKFMKFSTHGLRKEFIIVGVFSMLVGMLGMLTPMFTSKIFDSVIPAGDRHMHWHYIFALISAAIATTGFDLARSIGVLRVEGKMDQAGQSAIWSRMLDLPITFFKKYPAGDLADRAYAVDAIRTIISSVGVTAILGSTVAVFQGATMVFINFKLAAVGLGLVFLLVTILLSANWMQLRLQREEYSVRGRIAGIALQLLTGVSKIRVAAAEDHAFRVWATEFAAQKRIAFVIGRIQNFVEAANRCFPLVCSIALFAAFAYFKNQEAAAGGAGQTISTGQFIAFNTAFGAVLNAMLQLGMASLQLLEIVPIFERVSPILTEPAEVTDDRRHPGDLRGNIELYHVNFRYQPDGPLILRNLDLKIHKGEFVALVGTSGSGKSTVLRLLLGFENPESGYVYYEGQDLATLDLREVRKKIGAVLQSSQLMPTTMYHNIVGASTSLTMEDAQWAAKMSGLDADIREMPMGMHTVVSEGGGGFSGGQKQRLMIARALVHRPRIVFFDEATSALDNRTQRIVTQSLKEMDATRVTIAHRLSTVIDADRIIVLDKGSVIESGTYDELMALGGVFYELASRQQTEEV